MSYSRNRNKGKPSITAPVLGSASWGDLDYGSFVTSLDQSSMTDVVTPNYRKKVKQGAIINNPCSFTRSQVTDTQGSLSGNNTPGQSWFNYSGPVSSFWVERDGVDDYHTFPETKNVGSSQIDAIAGIDKTPYAFMEDLFELRNTLRFIRNPLRSIDSLINNIRRKEGRKVVISTADIWLAYRFGFMPLVRSASDAVDFWVSSDKRRPRRSTSRRTHSSDFSESDTLTVGGDAAYRKYSINLTERYSERSSILYELSNPIYSHDWALGMRWKDVPTTIWAVMPYSFMVDRIVDISTFSKAAINLADPSISILAGSFSFKSYRNRSRAITDKYDEGWNQSTSGGIFTTEKFGYERKPWSPSISDLTPNVNLGNLVRDATYIADLAALILSKLR